MAAGWNEVVVGYDAGGRRKGERIKNKEGRKEGWKKPKKDEDGGEVGRGGKVQGERERKKKNIMRLKASGLAAAAEVDEEERATRRGCKRRQQTSFDKSECKKNAPSRAAKRRKEQDRRHNRMKSQGKSGRQDTEK